jgi:hypothetical protein
MGSEQAHHVCMSSQTAASCTHVHMQFLMHRILRAGLNGWRLQLMMCGNAR